MQKGDPYDRRHQPEDYVARWEEELQHLFHDPAQIRRRDITTLAADYLLARELATDAEHRYYQRGIIAVWSNGGWLTDDDIELWINPGLPIPFDEFKCTSAYARACRDIERSTGHA